MGPTNHIKSTLRMMEFRPHENWKRVGPFVWLTVHYDHRFVRLSATQTRLVSIVAAEGLGASIDESGKFVTFEDATNDRKTIGMNGSGFVEMLARQMTADLQAQRDATPPWTQHAVDVQSRFFRYFDPQRG